MITDSPTRYRRLGLQEGHDPGLLGRAIANASLVEGRGLASVLTLKHLAWQSGASYIYLRSIIERRADPYTEILRHRKDGAPMRVISAPDPPLMAVQRWILRNIVRRMDVHPASSAYMPGDSILRCAKTHLGATWLIKMDVHNFFHSIDERQVYSIFCNAGYCRLVSLEMARLCTRANFGPPVSRNRRGAYVISDYETWRLGALPQGAPTSGPLANAVMRDLDEGMSGLAVSYDLSYTRYADDVVFSSGGEFSHRGADEVVKQAGAIFRKYGLKPHKGKTRIAPPGGRRIVLGLLVDGDSVRLPRETRQRIKDHVRGVREFGLAEHSRSRGFVSTFGFVNHVNGLIAFAKGIEPEFASKVHAEWTDALSGRGWRLPVTW